MGRQDASARATSVHRPLLLSGGGCVLGVRLRIRPGRSGRGELLERLQAHLDLRDFELQLLSRAAELPAPQLRELDLEVLDLQAVLAHQAFQIRYIIGEIVCLGHARIIRAVPRHARRCWKIM